jgi:DNA-binding NtrC family response regulator
MANTLDLPGPNQNLSNLVDDYERKLIVLALEAAGGHQRRAAASLGIRPTTLSEKLRRLGLRQRRKRQDAAQGEDLHLQTALR